MKEYASEHFSLKLEDGIIYVTWHKEYIDYHSVDFGIKKRLEITKTSSFPMLSDISVVKGASKEARRRLADIDAMTGMCALAIVYQKKLHMILYKSFLLLFKPPVPVKLFKNKAQALKWLEQFKT